MFIIMADVTDAKLRDTWLKSMGHGPSMFEDVYANPQAISVMARVNPLLNAMDNGTRINTPNIPVSSHATITAVKTDEAITAVSTTIAAGRSDQKTIRKKRYW